MKDNLDHQAVEVVTETEGDSSLLDIGNLEIMSDKGTQKILGT